MKKEVILKTSEYSDTDYVEGIRNKDPHVEKCFYIHCKKYFDEHYKAVSFSSENDKDDVFQNAFISLWQNIERGKINVKDGVLTGRNGEPFKSSLTTYLMSISRNKFMELARTEKRHESLPSLTDDCLYVDDWLEDDYENAMFEVISDSIAVMPHRCNELLTKFYYENKKLDDMLSEMPEYTSKDALKSNKNRCLNRLRVYAKNLYKIRKKN